LDEAVLKQMATQRPEFAALVDTVRATMSRGASYATSPTAVAQAALVVKGVLTVLAASSSASGETISRTPAFDFQNFSTGSLAVGSPAFATYPIAISGSTTQLKFANSSFASFGIRISPQPATDDELPGKSACALCWPPSAGILPVTTVFPTPSTITGAFTATASFGSKEKNAIGLQFGIDVFAGILRFAGMVAPESSLNPLIGLVATKVDIQTAVARGNWQDASTAIKSGLVSALPDIIAGAVPLFPNLAGRAGAKTLLVWLGRPLQLFDTGVWAYGRLRTYHDASVYWNTPPEIAPICLSGGTLYNFCASSVTVSFSATTLISGGTVQALATVKDADGNLLTGLPAQWTIASGPANITQTGLVTASGVGPIVVSALVQGISGSATINSQPIESPVVARVWTLYRTNLGPVPAPVGGNIIYASGTITLSGGAGATSGNASAILRDVSGTTIENWPAGTVWQLGRPWDGNTALVGIFYPNGFSEGLLVQKNPSTGLIELNRGNSLFFK
jgi:hypothetical protein